MKFRAAILNQHEIKPPFATTKPLIIKELELRAPQAQEVVVT